MTFLYYLFLFFFLFISFLLCFLILIQESKSSGFGASFGGDSSSSLFGTSTPEVLKKVTAWLALLFFGGCVLLSMWTGAMGRVKMGTQAHQEFLEE